MKVFLEMKKNMKIFVAGHKGMVGSAIIRNLKEKGFSNVLIASKSELDLRQQLPVAHFFEKERPDYVFLAAAKVGGIQANVEDGADFIFDNLMIQTNVIRASYESGVKKLLFLGSSCIYPRHATQPITEDQLLGSFLEPTNEMYAIAKIAGIKMCQAYAKQYQFKAISLMPTNLYGQGDNYDERNSHVIPAMIRRFHIAKENKMDFVECWGSGSAMREFMNVDDLAEACFVCMEKYDSPDIINVGTGKEITMKKLASLVSDIVGYTGEIKWNANKPDGMPRKLLDIKKITVLGWKSKIELRNGLEKTYRQFLEIADYGIN